MFILLHWYCHRGFGSGKMITFTLKIFNIFGDVYTRDGTISLCQRDASAQIVVSHDYPTQVLVSILFTPSVVTKWHDRHRYLSIHHVPYLMSLSRPRHCSATLSVCIRLSIIWFITLDVMVKWCQMVEFDQSNERICVMGTNEMGDHWDVWPMGRTNERWTSGKRDEWDGGPVRYGPSSSDNVMGDQWVRGPMGRGTNERRDLWAGAEDIFTS